MAAAQQQPMLGVDGKPLIWATRFADDTAGQAPAGWTKQYATGNFTALVQTAAGSISGKALRWTKTAAGRQGLSWDMIPPAVDVEILVRLRAIEVAATNENLIASYARGAGGLGTETGYRAGPSAFNSGTLWYTWPTKYISGTGTSLGASAAGPSPNYSANTWVYSRFRVVGTSIQSKIWYSGAAEPGSWSSSQTDADVSAAGWTGLQQASGNPDVEIDFVGVSIATPGNAPATIPVPI